MVHSINLAEIIVKALTGWGTPELHGKDHDMAVSTQAYKVLAECVDQQNGVWNFGDCSKTVVQLAAARIEPYLQG